MSYKREAEGDLIIEECNMTLKQDAMLMVLKMEERSRVKEYKECSSSNWKRQGNRFYLVFLEGPQPC